MSARNRRAARKIAILVRMDSTRSRMPTGVFLEMLGCGKALNYWESCMVPLGKKLAHMGLADRTLAALESARKKRIATGGWLIDGSLLYRLNEHDNNCDEINVTMADGRRDQVSRAMAANALLKRITAPQELEAPAWIAVSERLPEEFEMVLVYSPPKDGEPRNVELDYFEDGCWMVHAEHYEHFVMIGGVNAAGPDCECTGPSEVAPYTHWMPLPKAPGVAP